MILLNLQQVAESFGVSEEVIRDWVTHEGLPHVADTDRILFTRSKVAEWAEARGLEATAGYLGAESAALHAAASLSDLLRSGGVWRNVPGVSVLATLEKVVSVLKGVPEPVRNLLAQRVRADGGITWAPVGRGYALPHLRARVALGRAAGVVALIILRDSIALDEAATDDPPVSRLLFFIAPTPREHLDLLARLSQLVDEADFRTAVDRGDEGAIFRLAAESDLAQAAPSAGQGPQ